MDRPRAKAGKPKLTADDIAAFKARSILTHFFLGVEFNPRIHVLGLEVDIKMYLYVIGAQLLHLFIIDAAMLRYQNVGSSISAVFGKLVTLQELPAGTVAITTYLAWLSFFIVEYLWFETVHL